MPRLRLFVLALALMFVAGCVSNLPTAADPAPDRTMGEVPTDSTDLSGGYHGSGG